MEPGTLMRMALEGGSPFEVELAAAHGDGWLVRPVTGAAGDGGVRPAVADQGRKAFLLADGGEWFAARIEGADERGWRLTGVTKGGGNGGLAVDDVVRAVIRRTAFRKGFRSEVLAGWLGDLAPGVEPAAPGGDDDGGPASNTAAMFEEISRKLDDILALTQLSAEGLLQAERRQARLTAATLTLTLSGQEAEGYAFGDMIEIKLLLPARRLLAVLLWGQVTQVVRREDGVDVTVVFVGLGEDVKNALIHYELDVERRLIRMRRGYDS